MTSDAVRRTVEVTGFVQGVGFRPHVYRLATQHLLGGWVRNDARGVTICVEGPREAADLFGEALLKRLPGLARVDTCAVVAEEPVRDWTSSFTVRHSTAESGAGALVTPDSHVCADCARELFDPADRRHRYPLLNCTDCGPRYSIIRGLPYDRPKTTMADFAMCPECRAEYESPADRRFHAQPTACWSCGPQVRLLLPDGSDAGTADPVATAAGLLRDGHILAVKALGGYQLMADPRSPAATAELRARKERSSKPFALLVRDSATAAEYTVLDDRERRLLESPGRPIVLLRARPDSSLAPGVAPGSATLGLMLPATPLQHLLLAAAGPVLIATSANAPDEPMARTEEEALRGLRGLADAFLVHDREIHMRVDDSIARVVHSTVEPKVTFVRRARGYVPDPVPAPFPVPPVLALGAELKNTVCLGSGDNLYVSQHIGDLKSLGNQRFFADTIAHLRSVFGVTPRYVAHDLHPDFHSTRYAASCQDVRLVGVQHHHAHMASCMADNGLDRPVIGVVFDGTGYGTDGTIWGGEFLIGDYRGFERKAHLARFRLPGGDKAVREPDRVAIGLLAQHFGADAATLPLDLLRRRDPFEVGVLMKMATRGVNAPETSSMGRLFDACSALLGVCGRVGYEGQAAIELEQLIAWDHTPVEPWPVRLREEDDRLVIDHGPWLEGMVSDLSGPGGSAARVSRTFHESVVRAVVEVCLRLSHSSGVTDTVLSGGVFLNQHLLVRVEEELTRAGLGVYTHSRIPTNDGGLSVGQAMVAAARVGG
ncbi:carbamoyltransferase HypF [Streptomyces clavuligerus]|uniref:Carbamoyltransferase n=1 Tax=Streptomyces clavuligerus TaxID=1901 RepID=E2Q716_STRCL|nr:carbamoyltransferase HypF [Streptomyces clavuligerus]ANW21568.1 carbamoyltransferase HypF [Streptomyces clavuligerus]AXU16196.1 carbamoyltransferase HypF [Streptomyces clavuligerus]EFG05263.1 Hydrogenase maturation protein [Streptomyces clavuligerus]MBY6306349.1 carbamoyltransferase HypF [Streptomyces clavuligerus]QCS08975.1 carbamoyltransferase HypF [Streptomyces clavuligerus]